MPSIGRHQVAAVGDVIVREFRDRDVAGCVLNGGQQGNLFGSRIESVQTRPVVRASPTRPPAKNGVVCRCIIPATKSPPSASGARRSIASEKQLPHLRPRSIGRSSPHLYPSRSEAAIPLPAKCVTTDCHCAQDRTFGLAHIPIVRMLLFASPQRTLRVRLVPFAQDGGYVRT